MCDVRNLHCHCCCGYYLETAKVVCRPLNQIRCVVSGRLAPRHSISTPTHETNSSQLVGVTNRCVAAGRCHAGHLHTSSRRSSSLAVWRVVPAGHVGGVGRIGPVCGDVCTRAKPFGSPHNRRVTHDADAISCARLAPMLLALARSVGTLLLLLLRRRLPQVPLAAHGVVHAHPLPLCRQGGAMPGLLAASVSRVKRPATPTATPATPPAPAPAPAPGQPKPVTTAGANNTTRVPTTVARVTAQPALALPAAGAASLPQRREGSRCASTWVRGAKLRMPRCRSGEEG